MVSNINAAKEAGAQIIVVFFHWGTERETVPDSVQMELGHAAIDAGATLVVGSHPHVIQGMENYNGHTIVYSLGNFCFGGNKNPSDKDCMIVQQTFTVRGNDVTIDNTNVFPVQSLQSARETTTNPRLQQAMKKNVSRRRSNARATPSPRWLQARVAAQTSKRARSPPRPRASNDALQR